MRIGGAHRAGRMGPELRALVISLRALWSVVAEVGHACVCDGNRPAP